ncbi:MAG: hypothetical protein LBV16_02855 [Elusimicrobiota bacterium]|jgi:F420-0:gamma-glutamyl ligase|nr:hypothetical protein [Elusimicrobiota bacterium]
MKTKKIDDFEITLENTKITDDDFSDYYAKYLKARPIELKHYKRYIVQEYNKTKDRAVFLLGLQTIAKAEGKIKNTVKNSTNTEEINIYKNPNPSFESVMSSASDLGIYLAVAR